MCLYFSKGTWHQCDLIHHKFFYDHLHLSAWSFHIISQKLTWVTFKKHNIGSPSERKLNPAYSQVFTAHFYMGKFGGATPKRHRLWSNDEWLLHRIAERAGYMSRAEQDACPTKSTKKYIDKNGVRRCVGIKDVLQKSQWLNLFWSGAISLCELKRYA